MKKILFVLIYLVQTIYSQNFTLERSRVIVLPVAVGIQDPHLIEMVDLVINEMNKLGRFEVIDRSMTLQTMNEIALGQLGVVREDQAIQVGKMLGSKLGVIVALYHYSVEKKILETMEMKKSFKTGETISQPAYKYESSVKIGVKHLDLLTGENLHTFEVGGEAGSINTSESEAINQALNSLRLNLSDVLKEFYRLNLQILEKEDNNVTILGGKNLGLKKGMHFEVLEPVKEKVIAGRLIKTSQKPAGMIMVTSVDDETSKATILTGANLIQPNDMIREKIELLYDPGIAFSFTYLPSGQVTLYDVMLESSAYHNTSIRFTFGYGRGVDSREDLVSVWRAKLTYSQKLMNWRRGDLGVQGGAGFLRAGGRKDDFNNSIQRWKLQALIGGKLSYYLGERILIYSLVDYALGGKVTDWYTSEGKFAKWDTNQKTPEIDFSGFSITAGLQVVIIR